MSDSLKIASPEYFKAALSQLNLNQNKQATLASIIALAYLLLPFTESVAIVMLLCCTPFVSPRHINKNGVAFLSVLLVALIAYYLVGASENRPIINNSLQIWRVIASFVVILALLLVSPGNAKKSVEYLCIGVVAFVFIEGILTFIIAPDVALARAMIKPMMGGEVGVFHSTGQINAMSLAAGFLFLLSEKQFLRSLSLALLVVIAWMFLNRTGMIISAIYILYWVLHAAKSRPKVFNSKRHSQLLLAIALLLISTVLLMHPEFVPAEIKDAFLRMFFYDGLKTERYETIKIGLEQIYSGNHPFGGAQLGSEFSYPWYHNLYLDAYRVAGFPALALFLALTSISFYAVCKSNLKRLIFMWILAFGIAMSSVPLEGLFIEYTTIFTIFTYAISAYSSRMHSVRT